MTCLRTLPMLPKRLSRPAALRHQAAAAVVAIRAVLVAQEVPLIMAAAVVVRRAVLLRLITESFYERGPDISFASAFPAEAEFLFPPLTYLQPTGHVETAVLVEGLAYEVVDVRPRI